MKKQARREGRKERRKGKRRRQRREKISEFLVSKSFVVSSQLYSAYEFQTRICDTEEQSFKKSL